MIKKIDAIKPNMLFLAFIHFALTLWGDTLVFIEPYNAVYYWTKLFVLAFLIWFWQKMPDVINALRPQYERTYVTRAAFGYFLINLYYPTVDLAGGVDRIG